MIFCCGKCGTEGRVTDPVCLYCGARASVYFNPQSLHWQFSCHDSSEFLLEIRFRRSGAISGCVIAADENASRLRSVRLLSGEWDFEDGRLALRWSSPTGESLPMAPTVRLHILESSRDTVLAQDDLGANWRLYAVSDVFLPLWAGSDRPIALSIVNALKSRGRRAILLEHDTRKTDVTIRSARRVLPLWSRASCSSHELHRQTTLAYGRGTLYPVLTEYLLPPAPFHTVDCASLIGWSGDISHPQFKQFLDGLETSTPPLNAPEDYLGMEGQFGEIMAAERRRSERGHGRG